MTKRGALWLIAILVGASVNAPTEEKAPFTPEKAPQKIRLTRAVPILNLEFKVTQNGYELIKQWRDVGTPTTSVLNGAVRFVGTLRNKDTLTPLLVADPRRIRNVGTAQRAVSTVGEATLVIALPDSGDITSVEVEALRGLKEEFKKAFEIQKTDQ